MHQHLWGHPSHGLSFYLEIHIHVIFYMHDDGSSWLNGVHQQLNTVLMEGLLKTYPWSPLRFHMTRWMLHKYNDDGLFSKPQGYVCGMQYWWTLKINVLWIHTLTPRKCAINSTIFKRCAAKDNEIKEALKNVPL